jgi:pyridoxamine 5'-phosphate oxidase
MDSLAELRKEYSKLTLDLTNIKKNPITQFSIWFEEAFDAKVTEPNAMHLSTVSADGRPSGRIVLLKGIENEKFVFYTNYQSNKGKDLESNSACSLTFFWPELERQVRISGIAARTDQESSEKYFRSRPRASQIGAWASPQDSIIANREILEKRVKEIEKRFEGIDKLPKPNQWGGFTVDPLEIEFWQGRPSRLHDRILFTKIENRWEIHRLAP